jgi:hypothetical protein
MKTGEVYVCKDCGIELQVIKECKDVGTSGKGCCSHSTGDSCTLSCCGEDLVKKKS